MNIKSRISKLEVQHTPGVCECPGKSVETCFTGGGPTLDSGDPDTPATDCESCGRPRLKIVVEYVKDWRPADSI